MLCSRVPLYQATYSATTRQAQPGWARPGVSANSPISEAKKLSATALSELDGADRIEGLNSASRRVSVKRPEGAACPVGLVLVVDDVVPAL
jgi:hypothetical protein